MKDLEEKDISCLKFRFNTFFASMMLRLTLPLSIPSHGPLCA